MVIFIESISYVPALRAVPVVTGNVNPEISPKALLAPSEAVLRLLLEILYGPYVVEFTVILIVST